MLKAGSGAERARRVGADQHDIAVERVQTLRHVQRVTSAKASDRQAEILRRPP